MGEIISLNVGGHIFQTTTSTLQYFPDSFLGRMFAGDQLLKSSTKDKDGNWFIDRSHEYFGQILNMYRNGRIPEDAKGQLRKEIKFYFPGHFSLTEHQIEAKRYARCMYEYWKDVNPDEVYDFIVPCVRPYHSESDVSKVFKQVHKSSKGFGRDYVDLLTSSVMGLKSDQYDEKKDVKKQIDMILGNLELKEKLSHRYQLLEQFADSMDRDSFIDLACIYLQKMVGADYVAEWRYVTHTCGERNCHWKDTVLTGRGRHITGSWYDVPAAVFENILVDDVCLFPEQNIVTFPPHCCRIGTDKAYNRGFKCTFIFIHPRLKHALNTEYENTIVKQQMKLVKHLGDLLNTVKSSTDEQTVTLSKHMQNLEKSVENTYVNLSSVYTNVDSISNSVANLVRSMAKKRKI